MFPKIGSIEIQRENSYKTPETESDLGFVQARSSQNSEEWNKLVVAAVEQASNVNPFINIPLGSVIPAVDAVNWSGQGDIRPRL